MWLLLVRLCRACQEDGLQLFADFLLIRAPADARTAHLMLRMHMSVDAEVHDRFRRDADPGESGTVVWVGDAERVFRRLLGGRVDHSPNGLAVLDVQNANVLRMRDDLERCHEEVESDFKPAWATRNSLVRARNTFIQSCVTSSSARLTLVSVFHRLGLESKTSRAGKLRAKTEALQDALRSHLHARSVFQPLTDAGAS